MISENSERALAEFVAGLRIDWIGSALVGKGESPVEATAARLPQS